MSTISVYSHRTQLIATAVAASLTTAGILSFYTNLSRRRRRKQLDDEVRRAVAAQDVPKHKIKEVAQALDTQERLQISGEYDEELIKEQLARNYAMFEEEGMARIRRANVVVVGCGGVGSWAAVMLVRSGISKIRLIDFDYVTLSSLNRHATAVLSDVGTPKVTCIERTLKQISKWVEVDSRVEIWRKDEAGKLLEGADWVIDAIDNISTKVDLLKYCHAHSIKIFASMGAGAKLDPTRVQISDISHTTYDPLARAVRYRLRQQGVSSGIPVVYSTEIPPAKLLPLPEDEFSKGDVKQLAVFDDFRVRILPVIGPLPSIFGLNIATYIVCELGGKPIANPLPIKNRHKLYTKLLRDLLVSEEKNPDGAINKPPIDENDVSFVLEELHHCRSVVPPYCIPSKPHLARWDPAAPLSIENCVVFDAAEFQKHLEGCARGAQPAEIWGAEVAQLVARRAAEARVWRDAVM